MATTRSYGDGCGIARALDLVGERWALLVVRELLLGPQRFTDLRAGLPNASPNVLSQRLRELEDAESSAAARAAARRLRVYELTDRGRELEPIVLCPRRLGPPACPPSPRGVPVGTDSVVLALGTFFDADAADGLSAGYQLHLGEDTFNVRIADRRIELGRGAADTPDATIETDADTLASMLWNARELRRRPTRRRRDDRRRPAPRRALPGGFPHPRDFATVS